MLIRFDVSNFLSFDKKQELSMVAGKTRNNSERIYINRRLRLVKCQAMFGANGSGKSNLIKAIHFMQKVVTNGFPRGFSNSYCRLKKENKLLPTEFEIEFLLKDRRFCFGFTCVLNTGSIEKEWLYEITPTGLRKDLYKRDVTEESFEPGSFFKGKDAKAKLSSYGEDSSEDHENLFLSIINKNKGKMFADYPELNILHSIYRWFKYTLRISFPTDIPKGYLFSDNVDLDEIAEILNAFGTGISHMKFVRVSTETVKSKMSENVYNSITENLEKRNARKKKDNKKVAPSVIARATKEFYIFDIDDNNEISIHTIEFEHEAKDVYFSLNEESDGTARLFDLIEIFLAISDNSIFVIDEIDRCLHPAITAKFFDLFLQMAKERNTQLITTTHESRLLKENLLRSDEISFMLKTDNGSTIIKSLDKYQLRPDKNIYEALFNGTLHALPKFNDDKLKEMADRVDKNDN